MAELKTLNSRIVIRNATPEEWVASNPTLLKSEFGVELGATPADNKLKIGDGVTPWNQLAYTYDMSAIKELVDAAKPTAENVYFDENLIFTEAFGKYVPDSTGSVTVPTADDNMSVQDLFLSAFSEEKDPSVTEPTLDLSASVTATSGEVGTTYAFPTATASVTTGSFEYGSKDAEGTKYTKDQGTGITFSSISVKHTQSSKEQTSSNSNADVKLTLTSTEIPDATRVMTDNTITHNFTASATYAAATRFPVTNLGNITADEDLHIEGKTLTDTASVSITGYRCWFMYVGTDCNSAVTSDWIRTNATNKGNAKNAADQNNVTIVKGTKRVLLAFPTTSGYNKRLKAVTDVDGMGLPIFGDFNQTTGVKVEGANEYTAVDYIVYDFINTNGTEATRFTFDIG